MGIGKGKSDKIDLDGLIGFTDNENEALLVERNLTEKIAELKKRPPHSMPLLTVWKALFQISTPLCKTYR